MIKLNNILKNCSHSNKFKIGFIKYLKSLDFVEFDKLFVNYSHIFSMMILKINKPKFLSKEWFKYRSLHIKFQKIYILFSDANSDFVLLSNKNVSDNITKKQNILKNFKDNQDSLTFLNQTKLELSTDPSIQDVINVTILIVDGVYIREELNRLIIEYNKK